VEEAAEGEVAQPGRRQAKVLADLDDQCRDRRVCSSVDVSFSAKRIISVGTRVPRYASPEATISEARRSPASGRERRPHRRSGHGGTDEGDVDHLEEVPEPHPRSMNVRTIAP
jgi:hypothetical protein